MLWVATLGHPNDYNAVEGVIVALYSRYDNAVDRINIEWGYNRIIAERFMSVNKFGFLRIIIHERFTYLTSEELSVTGFDACWSTILGVGGLKLVIRSPPTRAIPAH